MSLWEKFKQVLNTLKENFVFTLWFMIVIWAVYFLDCLSLGYLSRFGIHPWDFKWLPGIILMPFLHKNFAHIFINSLSLAPLMFIALSYNQRTGYNAIVTIILIGGLGVFFLGTGDNHIGASGLIYGLIGYLMFLGYFEKSLKAWFFSIPILFFYTATIFLMMIPVEGVSWAGHFWGFVAGVLAAKILYKKSENANRFSW